MDATSLQLSTTPDGELLAASVGTDGPSFRVERDTFDTGYRATLTFVGPDPFLTVIAELSYGDDGTIVRSTIAADGSGIRYRVALDFADDPAALFSGGKLAAAVTVESDGAVHHGRFDGETWHPVGLEAAPTLPGLLASGAGPLLARMRPALDTLVAGVQRATGGAFSPVPGRPPTVPRAAPGTIETLSWWRGKLCKMGCAAASAATAAACCAAAGPETAGVGCGVCSAAAAAAGANCAGNCDD
jgi:hypothetical protein